MFNKIFTAVLAAAILVSIGFIIYINTTPNPRDQFTEFYMLNAEGKATNYPKQVKAGEPVEIILGVVNHEKATLSYRVIITVDGVQVKSIEIGALPEGAKWEDKVSFIPPLKGTDRKYQFLLFTGDSDKPHIVNPLTLLLDVN